VCTWLEAGVVEVVQLAGDEAGTDYSALDRCPGSSVVSRNLRPVRKSPVSPYSERSTQSNPSVWPAQALNQAIASKPEGAIGCFP
ncbi:hypothetical protein ACYST8_20315, partial [Pseudomonas inefficax]